MPRRDVKPARPVRCVAQPNVREVNWVRDAPGNVPAATRDKLAALSMEHTAARKQLDILRQTRGQRALEELKTPAHLQTGIPMSDDGVKQRAELAAVEPAEE